MLTRRWLLCGCAVVAAAGFRPSNLTLALALWTLVRLCGTRRAGLRYMITAVFLGRGRLRAAVGKGRSVAQQANKL